MTLSAKQQRRMAKKARRRSSVALRDELRSIPPGNDFRRFQVLVKHVYGPLIRKTARLWDEGRA